VTVAKETGHFAVLIFDLGTKTVLVRDGLEYSHSTWSNHIANVLAKYNLRSHNQLWTIASDTTATIRQLDNINCGPLACFHVYALYYPNEAGQHSTESSFSVAGLRQLSLTCCGR